MKLHAKVEFIKKFYVNGRRRAFEGDKGEVTAVTGPLGGDVHYCDVKLENIKKPLQAVPINYLREVK